MENISATNIKILRNSTGAGILDCKKALTEAKGDFDKAITILRKAGIAKASKKASRESNEGLITTKSSNDWHCIAQLSCETDFVARTSKFQEFLKNLCEKALINKVEGDLTETFAESEKESLINFIAVVGENMSIVKVLVWQSSNIFSYIHAGGKIGVLVEADTNNQEVLKNLAMHIAAYNPSYLSKDLIPEKDKEKEREIAREKAIGKPDNIVEKIISGNLEKWYKETCLLEQEWLLDDKKTVKQFLNDINVKRFVRLQIGK